MHKPVIHWFIAGLVIAAFVALGVVAAGDTGQSPYFGLEQPDYAPKPWQWALAGGTYYLFMLIVVKRLIYRFGFEYAKLALLTVIMVLAGNEALNVLLFRLADPHLALWGLVAMSILVLIAAWRVVMVDLLSAILLMIYLGWLGFDLVWMFDVMRLNR